MALQTFTPPVPPSPGTSDRPEIKLHTADFGDGYTQETPDGLNHIRRVIVLKWEMLTPAQCASILSFLRQRGGWEPFWYTPSDETVAIKWTCKEWDDQRLKNGLRSLSATLKQSFSLAM